jgi:transcriptional regulator with XRE-family HTH domain
MPVRRRAGSGERDYYRLRADAWQMQAVRLGIRPSVRALADASGVPKSTLYRVAKGQPPGPETTAALLRTLKLPFESLFEQVAADAGKQVVARVARASR